VGTKRRRSESTGVKTDRTAVASIRLQRRMAVGCVGFLKPCVGHLSCARRLCADSLALSPRPESHLPPTLAAIVLSGRVVIDGCSGALGGTTFWVL